MTRKGYFTIANMALVVVLLFVFAGLSEFIFTALEAGMEGAGPLTKAVLFSIPAVILFSILASPFQLAELRFEEKQKQRNRRGGRR